MALKISNITDPMCFVAMHESAHALAYIRAYRALEWDFPSFRRIFIRRDSSSPYIYKGAPLSDLAGMCEGSDIYLASTWVKPSIETKMAVNPTTIARMEWSILISLAGPLAEAAARGARSKLDLGEMARKCGSKSDFDAAEAILLDYEKLSKRDRDIAYFENRARKLVFANWSAIDALANALLVTEALEYGDAYAIVEPFLEPRLDADCVLPTHRF